MAARPRRAADARVRGVFRAVVAALALGSLNACGGGPASTDAGTRELLIVEVTHPTKREPINAGRLYLQMSVAETLLDLDDHGQPVPGLATAWTVSEDGRTWRFTLRTDARFHDGTAMTASHVAQALARARRQPGPFALLPIDDIGADGDALVVRLRTPSVLLLPVLTHFSTVVLGPGSFDGGDRAVAVVGTGPLRMVSTTEQEFTVERWTGWRGPQPAIARARYLSAGRVESRALLADSGQADVVFNLDWASLSRLHGRPDITVVDVPSPRTTILKVNAGHPFLRDRRAREAISLAIDRSGIAGGLFGNSGRAATQLLPPGDGAWPETPAAPLRTSVDDARRLLGELGWSPGPDGVLIRDGQRFSLRLQSHAAAQELPLIAAALQQQLRQVGIEIEVRIGTVADTPASHRDGSLQLALVNRGYLIVPEPTAALVDDFSLGGGVYGAMGWEDAATSDALAALAAGIDPTRAAELRAQVVNTLQTELPVIPLLFNRRTATINARVRDVHVDPFERTFGLARMRWSH